MPDLPQWTMKAADKIGVVMDDWLTGQGIRHISLPPPSLIALIILHEHDLSGGARVLDEIEEVIGLGSKPAEDKT